MYLTGWGLARQSNKASTFLQATSSYTGDVSSAVPLLHFHEDFKMSYHSIEVRTEYFEPPTLTLIFRANGKTFERAYHWPLKNARKLICLFYFVQM